MNTEKGTEKDTEQDVSTETGQGPTAGVERDSGALLRRTASYGGADVEAERDRLKRNWDAAQEQVGEWGQAANRGLRQMARATDECAHRHPWESIVVAALAGAALAACWLRRGP